MREMAGRARARVCCCWLAWQWWPFSGLVGAGVVRACGAKKSDSVPDNSRATVEVNAMVVTWVDDSPAGGGAFGGYDVGVRVWIIVPTCFVSSIPVC